MSLEPAAVEQIGTQLAIRWNDEAESYLELELLRRACPCAVCGGEAGVLGRKQRPTVSYSPQSFILRASALVGGYAFQFQWGDGHNTGIYSFDYLRRLSDRTGHS